MRYTDGQTQADGTLGAVYGAFRPFPRAAFVGIALTTFQSRLVRRLCAAVVILTALLLLAIWAARPTLRVDIAPDQIRPFANMPYTVPVPSPGFLYAISSDSLGGLHSKLVLYENGTRLGPAHALHEHIRDVGQGAYSHWGRTLIFSSSDGTDPRTNGRRYSLEVAAQVAPGLVWPATTALVLAATALLLAHADVLRFWALAALAAVATHAAAVRTATGALRPVTEAARRTYARRPYAWTALVLAASVILFALMGAFALLPLAAVVIGLAGVAVAAVQLLPLPVRAPRLLGGVTLALAGFVAFHLVLRTVERASGLTPEYLLAPYLRNALERASAGAPRPSILFVGSSHSELGIDEKVLGEALREQGHDVTVLRLVAGGNGMTEQWYQTRRFLEFAPVKPALVLFEASGAYHAYGPFYAIRANPLTNRAIATTDAESAYWGLRWLVQADWHLRFPGVSQAFGLSERLVLGLRLLEHFALREARIGFAAGASLFGRIKPIPNPVYTDKYVSISQSDFDQVLSHSWDDGSLLFSPGLRDWVRDFNRHQVETIKEFGVPRVGFYSMPMISDSGMQYLHYFCQHMTEQPCLDSAEPGLLKALAEDRHWQDGAHLREEGRIIYSRWLARKIAGEQGLLP